MATVAGENRRALELVAGEGVGRLIGRLSETLLNENQRRPI
jgi:hypothetical protein